MQIVELQPFTFPVPFNVVFKHSSATRRHAENFVVQATTDRSAVGFGEGCPRIYVTDETVASCLIFLNEHRESLLERISDVATLRGWIDDHKSAIDENPSAFCAIELAILDAFGKQSQLPIESLLRIEKTSGIVRYTGVMGDSPFLAFWLLAQRYRRNGFTDIKIKLSGHAKKDRRKLEVWKPRSRGLWRVRLDANNLWENHRDCVDHLATLPTVYWGIEEPMQARDFDSMIHVAQELNCKVILDESCSRVDDLDSIVGESWVCNLRISKMGGLIRTMELADVARQKGIELIVGAHVGETSLLSRAALVLVQFLNNAQLAIEGAFGTYLLKEDLTEEVIEFDSNSAIALEELPARARPGLGLEVKDSKLISLSG